jgi:hypothetical protein
MPDDSRKSTDQANEGEGNRTAARNYNRKTEAFAKSGKVERKAREARKAIEGAEGEELKRAEQAGKAKARPDPETP